MISPRCMERISRTGNLCCISKMSIHAALSLRIGPKIFNVGESMADQWEQTAWGRNLIGV